MTAQQMLSICVAVLVSLSPAALQAQSEDRSENIDPAFDKEQHQRWIEFYRQEAASYTFHLGSESDQELNFKTDPVLLYTNPVGARGLTHGAVFVWTHEGRCAVIGATWSHANTPKPNQRTVSHEFHSLSDEQLVARRDGETVWSTKQAGVRRITLSESPPGSSPFGRLAQMRRLARELTVTRHDPRNDSREVLRLLPKPLYRYANSTPVANDGAVFAYCVTWDPEVFVVIETRETAQGRRWCYAPIRFSHLTLTVRHNQQEVWQDKRGEPSHRDPSLGYKIFYKTSVQNEVLDP